MSIVWILIGISIYCFTTLIGECWRDYKKAKRRRRRSLSIEEFIKVKEDDGNHH